MRVPIALAPVALLLCALAPVQESAGSSPTPALLSATLTPGPVDAAGRIGRLTVFVQDPAGDIHAGQPLLRMPLVLSNVATGAAKVQDLVAEDARGPIALVVKDDPSGSEPYRRWTAARAVEGPLSIRYTVPIDDAPNPRGAAPPFELRSDDGTLSGLLGASMILPDSETPVRLSVAWTGLPAGGAGVSTLGLGDAVSSDARSPRAWEDTYVMGGRPGREPRRPAPDGFFGVWQGAPPFDAAALLRWTHVLYGFDLKFFGSGPAPYTVFLRPNLINAGGGVEVARSFVGTFDSHTDPREFRITLAHEMVHTFVGGLDQPDELAGSWYSEGLAVFYERVLPLRAGLIDRAAFLRDVNSTAARYYTDALNDTPNAAIAARFWADTRVRVLPYDRGALYFAEVDAAVRKASRGRRSLDDLVAQMLSRRQAGHPLTQADWVDIVSHELGEAGRRQFDHMMAGKLVLPPSDAFGPDFRRIVVPLRRYQLGFAPEVLVEPQRIVRGLIPGSAAAKAGLRNGDHILKPVPQDGIQADQHALLTLEVQRDRKYLTITYLPRGELMETYQWVQSATP